MRAASLLWTAAGQPVVTGDEPALALVAYAGPCWWCGGPSRGFGRPVASLPDGFPRRYEAACPEATHLCAPCSWSVSEHVSLPASYAAERIARKAREGRREIVSLRGGPAEKYLLLELEDGRIGLWTPATPAAAEEPWRASLADLRREPVTVGACRLVEVVSLAELNDVPSAKFRAFHHFGTLDRWWPCTDTDRPAIRAWLLAPPPGPWCGVIGDGKRHFALRAPVSEGPRCTVQLLDEAVEYEPAALADLLNRVEAVLTAGGSEEEILSGSYAGRGATLLLALRAHEPVLAPVRGSPLLDLVIYLRRTRKELATDAAPHVGIHPETPCSPTSTAPPVQALPASASSATSSATPPAPLDGKASPRPRQLGLWDT